VAFSFYLGGIKAFHLVPPKMPGDGTASSQTCLSSWLGFRSFAVSHWLGLLLFPLGPCFMSAPLPGRGMMRWHRIRRMPARRNSQKDESVRLDDVQVQIDSIAKWSWDVPKLPFAGSSRFVIDGRRVSLPSG
jgi:hypothetical protein